MTDENSESPSGEDAAGYGEAWNDIVAQLESPTERGNISDLGIVPDEGRLWIGRQSYLIDGVLDAFPVGKHSVHPDPSISHRIELMWRDAHQRSVRMRHERRHPVGPSRKGRAADGGEGDRLRLSSEVADEIRKLVGRDADSGRIALDVGYVVARLWEFLGEEPVRNWLFSHNARLSARPVDVIAMGKVGPVVDAIDAHRSFAY